MRKLIPIAVGAALLGALSFAAVAVAVPGHFNQGQGEECTGDATDQTASVTCTGTISGLGNEPIEVFVVINAAAGCSNPGNPSIPGQRRFVGEGESPDAGGSVDYEVTGTISCHGNQDAVIGDTVDLEGYACTSGEPRFSRKTGEQTNDNCELFDTVNNVPVN
jgi:hypothetical protein